MAKYYKYGNHKFYRHLAVDARFQVFGEQWGLVIEPRLHFSTNGFDRWEGKAARSYAIHARSEQYNNAFLNDILFWAYQFSKGKKEFELLVGSETVAVLSGVPLQGKTTFASDVISPPDRKVKRG